MVKRINSDLQDIEVTLLDDREKSYHVDNGSVKAFVPKSLVEAFEAVPGTRNLYTLTAPEWILTEKGLL